MATIFLILSTLACALITGLLYGYQCSVNPGLGQLSDSNYLAAMQSINQVILNPLFFASFMGTLLVLPLCTYLHYHTPRFGFLLTASLLYTLGVFVVTVAGNVPLNQLLATFDLTTATPDAMATFRHHFQEKWNQWHLIRTIASFLALLSLTIACANSLKQA